MDRNEPRMTIQVLKVLNALTSNPRRQISGADVGRLTGLASGVLYPILMRLEQAKWVQSEWEDGTPHELGRPRRRFYAVTALGFKNARMALKETASALRRPVWGTS
jgi:PadR family transcriptional regulator PadR